MIPPDLKFPMTAKQFLANAEHYLQRGDIILSRSPTFTSWLIRATTNSPFSHAALVFLLPQTENGLNNTFLLESIKAGVGIANLKNYVEGKSRSQIAIRRLERSWADDRFQKEVGGIMLDYVHAGYDFNRALKIGLSLLFGARLGWSKLSGKPGESMASAVKRTKRKKRNWIPPQFICGGFIQYGFLQAQLRRSGDADDVIFRDDLNARDYDELLAITPEDIATTEKLTWHYVIRNGWVHEVKTYAEAKRVMSSAKL
jgi:Permuted papain-like amidase enzyme, YaeF/YiiX, C92 family